jgi:LysM repeat protein
MRRKLVSLVVLLSLVTGIFALPIQASAQSGCSEFYTVQPGDNLYRIALRYGTSYTALASLNGLSNPNWIYWGMVLCVRSAPVSNGTYTVQPGDTLYRIARNYGVNMYTLAQVNAIYNINIIYVGQRLVIPA